MSASIDTPSEAARKPRPFQFRLSTLMLAMAAASAYCFMLRVTSGESIVVRLILSYLACLPLAGCLILLGTWLAAMWDVPRGNRLITAGKRVYAVWCLAPVVLVAAAFVLLSLRALAVELGYLPRIF